MRMSSNRFGVDYEVGRATVRRLGSFRPFIGAVFGMALYFLFQSELLHTSVPDDPGTSFFFFGILAFLAGFNERFTNVLLGKAGFADLGEVTVHRELTDDGADKRADDDSRQAKEQAEQRAKAGPDHGTRAGTELFGAQRRRCKVNQIACGAYHPNYDECPHTDFGEPVGPRRHDEAGDDQHCAGQGRKDCADEPDENQRDSDDPQQDGHTIRLCR